MLNWRGLANLIIIIAVIIGLNFVLHYLFHDQVHDPTPTSVQFTQLDERLSRIEGRLEAMQSRPAESR